GPGWRLADDRPRAGGSGGDEAEEDRHRPPVAAGARSRLRRAQGGRRRLTRRHGPKRFGGGALAGSAPSTQARRPAPQSDRPGRKRRPDRSGKTEPDAGGTLCPCAPHRVQPVKNSPSSRSPALHRCRLDDVVGPACDQLDRLRLAGPPTQVDSEDEVQIAAVRGTAKRPRLYTRRDWRTAAAMKPANSGCGSNGRLLSSGWNWTPTNHG